MARSTYTSNLEAARSGDPKAALEKLRDTLADQLDTTDTNVHAQLAAQYRATIADLQALGGADVPKAGPVDELRGRRKARASGGRTASDASRNA